MGWLLSLLVGPSVAFYGAQAGPVQEIHPSAHGGHTITCIQGKLTGIIPKRCGPALR